MSTAINYDVIVIGGGASGMMAASVAANNGARVLLIEKNKRLGEKLRITGGGRCNITNAEEDMRVLLSNYGESEKFLYSAFSRFGMQDSRDYFDTIGVPTTVAGRKRAFPESESAIKVAQALIADIKKNNVTVLTSTRITSFQTKNNHVQSVETEKGAYSATAYILATGGTSHPETGSTGDGFDWLSTMTHSVKQPTPTITPLGVKEKWVKDVSGLTLENAALIFSQNSKRQFKLKGSVLFTHFGVSGPLILSNAFQVAPLLANGPVDLHIDCFPNLNEKELDDKLEAILKEHHAKQIGNTLRYVTPPGMAALVRDLVSSSIDPEKHCSQLSKLDRLIIVRLLKALPLTVTRLMGLDKAVVADGGVSLKDIDTRTMQSKIIKNLYVTGDLLDIRRPTGGYSLQLCWTSGFIAGEHAAKISP